MPPIHMQSYIPRGLNEALPHQAGGVDLLLVRSLARRDLLCDGLDRDVDAQHHVVEVDQLQLQVLQVLALLRLAQLVGRVLLLLLLLLQLLLQAGKLRLGLLALGLNDFEALGE